MVLSCRHFLEYPLLNCFAALLIATGQGLVLVDTGLGQEDYVRRSGMLRAAQLVTIAPPNPEEAATRQIAGLGHRIEDVPGIVLTHMHCDHCSGHASSLDRTT